MKENTKQKIKKIVDFLSKRVAPVLLAIGLFLIGFAFGGAVENCKQSNAITASALEYPELQVGDPVFAQYPSTSLPFSGRNCYSSCVYYENNYYFASGFSTSNISYGSMISSDFLSISSFWAPRVGRNSGTGSVYWTCSDMFIFNDYVYLAFAPNATSGATAVQSAVCYCSLSSFLNSTSSSPASFSYLFSGTGVFSFCSFNDDYFAVVGSTYFLESTSLNLSYYLVSSPNSYISYATDLIIPDFYGSSSLINIGSSNYPRFYSNRRFHSVGHDSNYFYFCSDIGIWRYNYLTDNISRLLDFASSSSDPYIFSNSFVFCGTYCLFMDSRARLWSFDFVSRDLILINDTIDRTLLGSNFCFVSLNRHYVDLSNLAFVVPTSGGASYLVVYNGTIPDNSGTFAEGYQSGYSVGYNVGRDYAEETILNEDGVLSPINNIVTGFLNLEVFPGFRISYLLLISLGVLLFSIAIKVFLGG